MRLAYFIVGGLVLWGAVGLISAASVARAWINKDAPQ